MTKEEYIAKNAYQLAYEYFLAPEGVSRDEFIDIKYKHYVTNAKKKNAKPGQTLAEAFGVPTDTGLRIDDIPMKSVSRDYVTLEKEIKINNKVMNVQIRFKYKDYVANDKKNAKAGQTLAEAFGASPDTGLRIDDIPMKSVSKDYVTLEKMINVNNKLINVQIRFKYKDLL